MCYLFSNAIIGYLTIVLNKFKFIYTRLNIGFNVTNKGLLELWFAFFIVCRIHVFTLF